MDEQAFDRMMQMLVDNKDPQPIREIAVRLLTHVEQGGDPPFYWTDTREDYIDALEKIIRRMSEAILDEMDTSGMLN